MTQPAPIATYPPSRPIVATALWLTVMTAAAYTCQCTGSCGSRHTASGLVCGTLHDSYGGRGKPPIHLIAAPADLALTPAAAAGVPAADLRAWCPRCHTAARRLHTAAARDAARRPTETPTLFDL